jgi:transcription initiation factor IIE alpha subunit
MKGKVARVANQSEWNMLGFDGKPSKLKEPDFFVFRCKCWHKSFTKTAYTESGVPTHCPDCGNELEESTDLKDFE